MPKSTVLLFQTHFFDRWCERAFAQITKALPSHIRPVVLIHLPAGAPVPPRLRSVPHHVARTPELRFAPYTTKAGGEGWDLWSGGHTDLILMHWWRAQNQAEISRVWVVEYDVRFSGNWRSFIDAFEEDDADLLAPGLITRAADPSWYNWPSLSAPVPVEDEHRIRGFLPIFRASARLMARMDEAYREGWGGHCEATWPTIAAASGFAVVDPGGDGDFTPERYRGRFYRNVPAQVHLAPGTLIFKPALYRMGTQRDMLWHPVKPFWWRVEAKEGLRDIKRRIGVIVRFITGAPNPALGLPGRRSPPAQPARHAPG